MFSARRSMRGSSSFFFRAEGAKVIRRTSGVSASKRGFAYVDESEAEPTRERESEVSLVLVTFLSSGTPCHVNLLLATFRHGVFFSLFLFLLQYSVTGCLRPIDHEESEWMDGWTGGQALDASEKNITGAP